MTRPALTLLFDPLCGWCYGAQPALAALDAALSPDWTFLPTGMFARPMPMSADRAEYFWQNDQRIEQLTGQTFSEAYRTQILTDLATPFDSTLATLAWSLIHRVRPSVGLDALHKIQALRYVAGVQFTPENLAVLALEYGLDVQDFVAQLKTNAWPPFALDLFATAEGLMQRHRIRGVPALLQGDVPVPNQYLYQPQALLEHIAPASPILERKIAS